MVKWQEAYMLTGASVCLCRTKNPPCMVGVPVRGEADEAIEGVYGRLLRVGMDIGH